MSSGKWRPFCLGLNALSCGAQEGGFVVDYYIPNFDNIDASGYLCQERINRQTLRERG